MWGRRCIAEWVGREREALCETILSVGADAPTVWEGWSVKSLLITWLNSTRPKLRPRSDELPADCPLETLIEQVRQPPARSLARPGTRQTEGLGLFLLHEDIRRAQAGCEPRSFSAEDQLALWLCFTTFVSRALRLRVGDIPVVLEPTIRGEQGPRFTVIRGSDPIVLTGPVGELAYYCFSHGAFAHDVSVDGPPEKVEALRTGGYS